MNYFIFILSCLDHITESNKRRQWETSNLSLLVSDCFYHSQTVEMSSHKHLTQTHGLPNPHFNGQITSITVKQQKMSSHKHLTRTHLNATNQDTYKKDVTMKETKPNQFLEI